MNEEMIGKDLSSCEKLIMKIVWDAEGDISTPEVIEELRTQYNKDYARTTVVTFILRLTEKGYVTTYRKGRISYVHAERNEKEYRNKFFKDATDFWFKGDVSKLVSALCDTKKLSEKEITRIKETIDKLDD